MSEHPFAAWSLAAALALAALPVLAAGDVLGTAVVNGRRVEILSDSTWRYQAELQPGACEPIAGDVSFCNGELGWLRVPPSNNAIAAQYQIDAAHYAMFIEERLGSDNGVTMPLVRDSVLRMAANGARTSVAQIPILETTDVTVDGLSGETMVYAVTLNNLDIVMANSIVIAAGETVQIITYSVGAAYDQRARDLHATLVAATRISQ